MISTFVLSVAYEDWLSHKGHVPVLLEAPHPDLASEAPAGKMRRGEGESKSTAPAGGTDVALGGGGGGVTKPVEENPLQGPGTARAKGPHISHPEKHLQVKVCEGRQLCLCLRLQGDSFLGRYPRSLQLSGHPSELHWLPLNLSKQRSVNLDAHAELTAALPTSPETIHSSWKGLKLVIGANPRSPATGRHAQGRPVPFRWARPPSTLKPDYPLGKELLRNWRGL